MFPSTIRAPICIPTQWPASKQRYVEAQCTGDDRACRAGGKKPVLPEGILIETGSLKQIFLSAIMSHQSYHLPLSRLTLLIMHRSLSYPSQHRTRGSPAKSSQQRLERTNTAYSAACCPTITLHGSVSPIPGQVHSSVTEHPRAYQFPPNPGNVIQISSSQRATDVV